jgi:16S rRNA (cytidine1402-2'-O)-methyltransferase
MATVSARRDRGARQYVINGQAFTAPALAPGLHLVATPIGNLRDITLRALEALAAADLIACEDTRRSRTLLDHYGISTRTTPYHDHNAAAARPKLIARLENGAAIALISDAGTPLVSDPGFKLVREALALGRSATAVPGPSAVLAALSVSGMPADRFFFEGFLPPKQSQRQARIEEIKSIPASVIVFEAGPRIGAALNDLAAAFGRREAAVCRELTKLHEDVRRGELATLAGEYAGGAETRGEIVIVISPPRQEDATPVENHDALLQEALRRLSLKDAVAEIAARTGAPRRMIYQRALALREERDHGR